MPELTINNRQLEHIYDEMWAYLRRSYKHSVRINEQKWLQNLDSILQLRQQLIDHNNWGISHRDKKFDRRLKLSLVNEHRLALRRRKECSRRFTLRLIKELRYLVLDSMDPDSQKRLANIGVSSEEIEDFLLGHIVKIDTQDDRLPDSFVVDTAQNMLYNHYVRH